MASMLLSTLSMFLSREAMFLFILILAGFFLFYTDAYDWKEKWKRWRAGHSRKEKAARSSELEKLNALKNAGLLSKEEYRERKREIDSL